MDLGTIENIRQRLNLTHLSTPALIGVVGILVMVAVAAGRLLIGTATANEFELVRAGQEAPQEEVAVSEAEVPETLFIHVSGEVVHPGLVEVPAGARVADAVQAAGGFTEDALADSVNLARSLADGEQIVIARRAAEGEAVEPAGGGQADGGQVTAAVPAAAGLVNINTATAEELVALPGIGQATADKIIADRKANGPFKTIDDLKRVSGIGDKKLEALSGLICV